MAHKPEKVLRGRRAVGVIHRNPAGDAAYFMHAKMRDIHRHKEKTISDAIRKGVATWGIDEETLINMRARGVKFAGIICRDTNDRYLTMLDSFFDRAISQGIQGPRCMPFRHLPISMFRRMPGRVKI